MKEANQTIANTKHWLYGRYRCMCRRCYDESNKDYQYYGKLGIKVAPEWHPGNPDGFENFIEWVETKLKALGPSVKTFYICRRDSSLGFHPDNCLVTRQKLIIMQRRHRKLSEQDVIQLRESKRAGKLKNVTAFARQHGISISAVFGAIRGRHYRYLNKECPPVLA